MTTADEYGRRAMGDYLHKLADTATTALHTLNRRKENNPATFQRKDRDDEHWWKGYYQAIEDVQDAYHGDRQ